MIKKIRRHLKKLRELSTPRPQRGVVRLWPHQLHKADAIVTANEVTDRHGTGVLLRRIFGQCRNVLSIRSTNLYNHHDLGKASLCFGHEGLSRPESFARVLYALNGATVQRVLCVPYHAADLITALVIKELFGVPLCTYLMDDNNIFQKGIPDELMREALDKSALRLAISPEMRDAYERKYHLKFWVVPPIVNDETLRETPEARPIDETDRPTGVLIGSLWSGVWLDRLRQTIKQAGLQVHWYGNTKAWSSKVSAAELLQDGIHDCGFLPEAELTARMKQYAYALVPSGTLDEHDDRPEIARLSLPTRLPYLVAVANAPIIVLGSPQTAAASFLERFQVGRVAPYDGKKLLQIVKEVCRPEQQLAFRTHAAGAARHFSAKDLSSWLWRSLALGEPCDDRFERVFGRNGTEIVPYLETPAPKDLYGDFVDVYQALRRLKGRGFLPDFVLDVGASSGVWSDVAKRVFPQARFVLVDPLHAHYRRINDWYFRIHPDFECISAAVSDCRGEAVLNVSADLYGSSLFHPQDLRTYDTVKVPVVTLDDVARDRKISGRGLLKIDVQFAEHLVLKGGEQFLSQVDALLVELSLVGYADQAMLFPEMCDLIRRLGFRYYEDVGGWRSPCDGTLLQKDVLFVREQLFAPNLSTSQANAVTENAGNSNAMEPVLAAKPSDLQPATL